ncbi:MAG: hypothetical protein H0X51_01395 [Parachlamydiaceae bacterium]|nr:hypothetical protein [Parachlamydiaceae bacterium]
MRYLLLLSCVLFMPLHAKEEPKPSFSITPTTPEEMETGVGPYKFCFKNFPTNTPLIVSYSRVLNGSAPKATEEILLTPSGLIAIKGVGVARNYIFEPVGILEGERITYQIKQKRKLLAEHSFIPLPLEITSKQHTFSLSAELLEIRTTTLYRIFLKGLPDNEIVKVTIQYPKERTESEFKVGDVFALLATERGKKGGICTLTIERTNGDSATLELLWGLKSIAKAMTDAIE